MWKTKWSRFEPLRLWQTQILHQISKIWLGEQYRFSFQFGFILVIRWMVIHIRLYRNYSSLLRTNWIRIWGCMSNRLYHIGHINIFHQTPILPNTFYTSQRFTEIFGISFKVMATRIFLTSCKINRSLKNVASTGVTKLLWIVFALELTFFRAHCLHCCTN